MEVPNQILIDNLVEKCSCLLAGQVAFAVVLKVFESCTLKQHMVRVERPRVLSHYIRQRLRGVCAHSIVSEQVEVVAVGVCCHIGALQGAH